MFAGGHAYVLVRVDFDGRRGVVCAPRFVGNLKDGLTLLTRKLTGVVGMDTASGGRHVAVGHSETVKQDEKFRAYLTTLGTPHVVAVNEHERICL